jgi:PAS domain-containing protein
VDAIMVSGDKGEQVYSVSSAETPYRTFIEKMSEGAVTLTREGTILFCNQDLQK